MKPYVIDMLHDSRDLYSLTKTALALCEPYGQEHAFSLVHNRAASRVACFIELESLKQQPALAHALDARTLNGAARLDVPERKDFASQRADVLAIESQLSQQPAGRTP